MSYRRSVGTISTIMAFFFVACATSEDLSGARATLPIAVQVDGGSVPAHGRVWTKDKKPSERVELEAFKEKYGPTYDERQKQWFARKSATNVRMIIDAKDTWWIAAESGLQAATELRDKYPGANSVSINYCDVDEDCDVTLRVRKDAANVDNLEDVLWTDWYEVRATIPSHRKDYEEALQKDPKVKGYVYIRIDFDEDGVSAEYVREGYVNARTPLDIQPLEDTK